MADTQRAGDARHVRHGGHDPEASEGDRVEQLTPGDEEGSDEEVVQEREVDPHGELADEADVIEQHAPVSGDEEDYPYGTPE